MARNMGGGDG
jgi:hypothetical protein